jgi:cobalt-zinc-cadmium efflux system outer membrane protein
MISFRGAAARFARPLSLSLLVLFMTAPLLAQSVPVTNVSARSESPPTAPAPPTTISPLIARYFDPRQGTSSVELLRRALSSNGELAAARLDIERARARLRQAGLRPNPTLEFEQTTGKLTGSPGERETSIGVALPLEVSGQRGRRVDLARAELEAIQAEIQERERRLASDVLLAYAEALSALRELEITEGLADIDLQTTRFVQARVNEGESPPIELNLLQAEVERLRARRALVEGRLQVSLLKLKILAGVPVEEPLRLREALTEPLLKAPPASPEAAINIALRTRPDLRLARLNEAVAQAGLRLSRAQGRPDVAASARYTMNRSTFDDTPVGPLTDRDRLLTFGISVGLPVFNKNQGAKEEAALAITQAERRREFQEQLVRSEVASAYARYEAARTASGTFELGVISRSTENIRAIRAAYQLGEYRITDLLAEQRRLLDSQREFTEALAERYRALADLQIAIGMPLTESER